MKNPSLFTLFASVLLGASFWSGTASADDDELPAVIVEPPDEPVSAPQAPTVVQSSTHHAAAESTLREDAPRSAVELAIGPSFVARKLETKELYGSGVAGELGGPGLIRESRYRPSLRLGATFSSSYEDLLVDRIGRSPRVRNTTFLGVGLDLCPVGFAVVSTRRLDLTLSACGSMNVGSAGALDQVFWTDAGGIGRVTAQIGSKHHFRGFVDVSGGALARLGQHLPGQDEGRGAMWTFALGGGVLFP